jgi:mRNA-decapping enzyme 1B
MNKEASAQAQMEFNLSVLQRMDKNIISVLFTSKHVTLYILDEETQAWKRREVKGPLFVVDRKIAPIYQIVVLNRLSTEPSIDDIVVNTQTEDADESYAIYQNGKGEVIGAWFYDPADKKPFLELISRLVKELTAKQQPQQNVPHEDLHQKITDNIMKDLFGRKEEVTSRPPEMPSQPQNPLGMNPPMNSVNDDLRMLFSLPGLANGPTPPPGLPGPMGMNIPGMPMPGPMLPPHLPYHMPMNPSMPQPGLVQRAQMTSSSGATMISPLLPPSGPNNPPGPFSQQGPQRQQLVSSGSVMPPMSGSQPPMNAPLQPPPGHDMKALPAPSQSTPQSTAQTTQSQKNPASESSTVTTQPSKKPERPQPTLPEPGTTTVPDGQAKQPTTPAAKAKPLTQPLFFSPQNTAKTLGTAVSAVSAVPAPNSNATSAAPKAASLTKLQLQQMLTKLVQDPKFIDLVYTEYLATLPPK